MSRYAIIQNGIVINVIEYDIEPSNPPPGFDNTYVAIQSDKASVGYTYVNNEFVPPQPYPSWIYVDNVWIPPISAPIDKVAIWDELNKSWLTL